MVTFTRSNSIKWMDILILMLLWKYNYSLAEIFDQRDRDASKFNQFLSEHNIEGIYARPMTSVNQAMESIKALKRAGFLTGSRPYEITEKGYDFIDDWRFTPLHQWPVYILIEDMNWTMEYPGRPIPTTIFMEDK